VYKQENSTRASFRRSLFECLQGQKGWEGCETLLDSYEALLKYRELPSRRCPLEDCEDPDSRSYRGFGKYKCECGSSDLYSTDSLRIFEGINSQGSSGEAFGEVLQVLERLRLVHLLRMIEQKGMLAVLPHIAFVIDGPLAIYGHPAWLSQAISKELRRI